MRLRNTIPNPRALVLAAVVLTAIAPAADAALGDHVWSKGLPAEGAVAVDGADHFVVHGAFFGTIDLGGGSMSAVNFLDGDQFLARYDAAGNHLWSVQFTPTGSGASNEIVTVDPAGNIYISGYLFGTTTIDYGGGTITAPTLYVAKFDANGNHLWSAGYGDGRPTDIAADGSNVVVTGYTSVGLDFGGGTVGNAGGNDIFVTQFTAAGAHAWSAGFGDAGDQGGMGVDIDPSGNVILSGSLFGTADFGGGTLTANGLDMFLASFTPAGAHNWSQIFDGTFTPGGGILLSNHDVDAGASGRIALCGELVGSTDFGGGTVSSNGFADCYVAVFDGAGAHQWSAAFGNSTGSDNFSSVAIDASDNVLICGGFVDDTDFGGGTVTHNGQSWDINIVVALYDANGVHQLSSGYGPSGYGRGAFFDASGRIIVAGSSWSGIDMGGGTITPANTFFTVYEGEGGPPSAAGTPASGGAELRAFPNPFNPTTSIEYVLDAAGPASVAVYDVRGRLVDELVSDQWHDAGSHSVTFRANASGVYFVTLRAGGIARTIKTVAIK